MNRSQDGPSASDRQVGRRRILRAVNIGVTVVGLLVIAAAMGAMIAISARAAAGAEQIAREYFYRLAWIAAAMLGLALVMLAWTCVRHLRRAPSRRGGRTPYVDAWSEAGRRIEPDEDDQTSDE